MLSRTGLIDANESPEDAAIRELEEETVRTLLAFLLED